MFSRLQTFAKRAICYEHLFLSYCRSFLKIEKHILLDKGQIRFKQLLLQKYLQNMSKSIPNPMLTVLQLKKNTRNNA